MLWRYPDRKLPTQTRADMIGSANSRDSTAFPIHRSWKIGLIVAIIMILLALLGVGLATTNKDIAPTYWICLVPVYGMLCVATAWSRVRRGEGGRVLVVRQALHWLVIAGALGIEFFLRGSGEETGKAAGFNALLLLTVGCFLAGVHMEWLFIIVGILLALLLFVMDRADQYLWLIMIVGIVVLIAMALFMKMLAKTNERPSATGR
jgi:hypothetical protein